mgnify:CR=1 FL=1
MSNSIGTFAYTYDALGRRIQRIDDGTTTNLFGYNLRSELVSAEMGTNTDAYAYDPIGNRTETVENGLTTTYAANVLNQYTALNPASPNPTPFTYRHSGLTPFSCFFLRLITNRGWQSAGLWHSWQPPQSGRDWQAHQRSQRTAAIPVPIPLTSTGDVDEGGRGGEAAVGSQLGDAASCRVPADGEREGCQHGKP